MLVTIRADTQGKVQVEQWLSLRTLVLNQRGKAIDITLKKREQKLTKQSDGALPPLPCLHTRTTSSCKPPCSSVFHGG